MGEARWETRGDPSDAVMLRPSDPAYTERLAAFLESLGQKVRTRAEDAVELERAIPEAELAIYLRVWSVLYPETTVSAD